MATEVIGPIPKWVVRSARQPGWRREQAGQLGAQRVQLAGEPIQLPQAHLDGLPAGGR